MFPLFVLFIFISKSTCNITYNWNKHVVDVIVFGELHVRDHLLDNYHFVGEADLIENQKVIFSFPADNGYMVTVSNITCVKIKIYENLTREAIIDLKIGGPGKHYAAYFLIFPRHSQIEFDILVYGIPNDVYYPWPGTEGAAHDEYS